MQVAASTRLCAEHRHDCLHTQQEGRARGIVHSVQRHFPQCSHTRRCLALTPPSTDSSGAPTVFESTDLEHPSNLLCGGLLLRAVPAIRTREGGVPRGREEEEAVVAEKGTESTIGVGAAWSSRRWSDEVLLLELIELGRPLKFIQGWVESCVCECCVWWW